MLKSILSKNSIQVVDSVSDWQDALKKASQPLLDSGVITGEYVSNMIKSVQDNGPYMVLTDYFALMHARPGEGVSQNGMSLLVTRNQVDLEGKPIKIFLVMAATDNTSHLKSLQNVMSVFMDQKAYQTILDGNRDKIIELFN
ncbi:MAG TPA: PTS sugar transporter subunit IIA [Candidatus Companilactobacillus pullicola]|uniref:Ascorbate-specific PTS system EIIA component n=1 Tax=Candidatus Companilactobacillus pullicola TaxID=2838523 RepID=A0A9D1ZN96_9LACO|nr:PTS sugar transporter subunit IIA [Candidatus Companilactobacillus pullicola]